MNKSCSKLIDKPSGSFSQTIEQNIIQFKVPGACQILQRFDDQGDQETDQEPDVPFTYRMPYGRQENTQRKQHEHIFICKPGMSVINGREQNQIDRIVAADFPCKKCGSTDVTDVHTKQEKEERRPLLFMSDNGVQKITGEADAPQYTGGYQIIFPKS